MYYLDTNTCTYFLIGRYESIKSKIVETSPNDIIIIKKIPEFVSLYKKISGLSFYEKIGNGHQITTLEFRGFI